MTKKYVHNNFNKTIDIITTALGTGRSMLTSRKADLYHLQPHRNVVLSLITFISTKEGCSLSLEEDDDVLN